MANILFTRTIHCPWCSTQVSISQGWNLQSFVSCSTCGRKFSTSSTNDIWTETSPSDLRKHATHRAWPKPFPLQPLGDEYRRPETVSRQVSFRLVHIMLMSLDLAPTKTKNRHKHNILLSVTEFINKNFHGELEDSLRPSAHSRATAAVQTGRHWQQDKSEAHVQQQEIHVSTTTQILHEFEQWVRSRAVCYTRAYRPSKRNSEAKTGCGSGVFTGGPQGIAPGYRV
ncbi:hypothetical protein DFH08DRAFT_933995 [Mycena albidolilacea]|uniref:Uncharacterized protein n=1 Tax=Mycena albidolilacea TaxID=1033008 RepID=A0AAD7EX09_9AGAR|nr:hypothetical protein DFH08DRAFT_933995 [Mycena albidolilacea]